MPIFLLNVFIAVITYMSLWFFLSILLKRNDVADVAWGLGFITICVYLYYLNHSNPTFNLIALLTFVWGMRLATHIFLRNMHKKEDHRYKIWRDTWGRWFYLRSFFQVFMLQGLLMIAISFSAVVAAYSNSSRSFSVLTYLGIFLWLVGFFFESIGDYQLSRFISDRTNSGKIMTKGLWHYTRHPNYFGEVAQWWGIFLIVISTTYNFLALISPLTITFLLLKISGIPLLEKKYEGNIDFEVYKKTTSAFFPWFPQNNLSKPDTNVVSNQGNNRT